MYRNDKQYCRRNEQMESMANIISSSSLVNTLVRWPWHTYNIVEFKTISLRCQVIYRNVYGQSKKTLKRHQLLCTSVVVRVGTYGDARRSLPSFSAYHIHNNIITVVCYSYSNEWYFTGTKVCETSRYTFSGANAKKKMYL